MDESGQGYTSENTFNFIDNCNRFDCK
jgi:hypothetical protein